MKTAAFAAFVRLSTTNGYSLRIPHIAYLEAARKYFLAIDKYQADIDSLLEFSGKTIAGPGQLSEAAVDVANLMSRHGHLLWGMARKFDAALVYNKPIHKDMALSRILNLKPPIKRDHINTRDTLIWLSVLNYVEEHEGEFVFVSSDNDFSDKSKTNRGLNLHPALQIEINQVLSEKSKFHFFKSLPEFLLSVAKDLTASEEGLAQLQSELALEVQAQIDLRERISRLDQELYSIHYQLRMAYATISYQGILPEDPEATPEIIVARSSIAAQSPELEQKRADMGQVLQVTERKINDLRTEIETAESLFYIQNTKTEGEQ
jgi:PIN domain